MIPEGLRNRVDNFLNRLIQKEKFGIAKKRVPPCFAIIPSYHISRLFSFLYGRNMIKRNSSSKVLQWVHGGKKLAGPIFDFKKSFEPNIAMEKKVFINQPLYRFIKKEFAPGTTIKVLDIGAGDGVNLFALAQELPEFQFEFVSCEPGSPRVENAHTLFRERKPTNVKGTLFYVGTFEQVKQDVKNKSFDIVICDQVITLMEIAEFEDMIHIIADMDITYFFVSARMNYYHGIVGGTMPVYERMMKKYENMRLRDYYYYFRRPHSMANLFLHPIDAMKPLHYFHYKYLLFEKLR